MKQMQSNGMMTRIIVLYVIFFGVIIYYLFRYGFNISSVDQLQRIIIASEIGLFIALLYSTYLWFKVDKEEKKEM